VIAAADQKVERTRSSAAAELLVLSTFLLVYTSLFFSPFYTAKWPLKPSNGSGERRSRLRSGRWVLGEAPVDTDSGARRESVCVMLYPTSYNSYSMQTCGLFPFKVMTRRNKSPTAVNAIDV